jgi:hypothetical protein
MYTNIILSISNFLGIPAILRSKNLVFSYLLTFTITFSSLHHLTETNEVGHNLSGTNIPVIKIYGSILRYFDIFFAILVTLFIIHKLRLQKFIALVKIYFYPLITGLTCSFCCDFIVKDEHYYLILHSIWHIMIYYILYKISVYV